MSIPLPENRLLAALPPSEFARLTARMTDITFGHKDLLYRASAATDYVYFPRSGVLSAVIVMADGASAEVAAIGREGMIGAAIALGAVVSTEQVFCQVPTSVCRRLPADEFAAEVRRSQPLRGLVNGYLRASLTTSARQTACNCLHSLDERCARWLLICHDAVGEAEFSLTHEFLSVMLGVRRATVTVSAGHLQTAGAISYRHGLVTILNRKRLEVAACECYRVIRDVFTISPA
jgi:CRP-like cAMP-binding protein